MAALALLSAAAMAEPEFLDTFMSHYKISDTSPLGEKSCGICHTSDEDYSFNPYGKDVKKALTDAGATSVTPQILESIESIDSNGDGIPNGKEIAEGNPPGQVVAPKPGAPVPTPAPKPAKPFPPKNGFHPAIVHFPIALFIVGLFLDFLGLVRKDKGFLLAGWLNVLFAAISSIGAVASGLLAMTLLKLPYKGLILQHLILALSATVLMWIMVAMRVDRHEKMNLPMRLVYYVLALACFIIISYAGHLGGAFVYGE